MCFELINHHNKHIYIGCISNLEIEQMKSAITALTITLALISPISFASIESEQPKLDKQSILKDEMHSMKDSMEILYTTTDVVQGLEALNDLNDSLIYTKSNIPPSLNNNEEYEIEYVNLCDQIIVNIVKIRNQIESGHIDQIRPLLDEINNLKTKSHYLFKSKK